MSENKLPTTKEDDSTKQATVETNKISNKQGTSVKLNDIFTFPDMAEMTVKKGEFAEEIHPTNQGSFHTYYKSEATDKEYFHIVGTLKNISNKKLELGFLEQPLNFKLIYQDKYEYDGFIVIEEDGGKDFSLIDNVKPLTTVTYHALIEIPKEIQQSNSIVTLLIECNEITYNLQFQK